jgi:cobalt-zinc-cadmium efflux system outer membrane protein
LLRALTRDVKQAYYQVVLTQRSVAIYDEILIQLSEIQHANALRWKSGDISETEFRRSELEVLKAKTDVEQAHLRLDTNRQLLAELLSHGTDWQSLSVNGVFPKQVLPIKDDQAWVRKAVEQRADLAASATFIQQQEKLVELAEVQKIPDITAGLQYQHNTSAIIPDSTGVGLSVNIPLWHQYQGEVSIAKASKRAADVAWQLLGVQIKTQVSVALSQFRQKQNVLERYDGEMLSRAKQVRASSVLAYRQGAISLLELLDAEKNYRNTLLEYDQALFDQTAAWLDLMYAVGEEEVR